MPPPDPDRDIDQNRRHPVPATPRAALRVVSRISPPLFFYLCHYGVFAVFARFRKRIDDARKPSTGMISAARACPGKCHDRRGQRVAPGMRMGTGCPLRPRCRWRIEGGLVPYRLLVSLVESRRAAGRIRQEHIADLGAIDGHWLPAFFDVSPPDSEVWFMHSVAARLSFWDSLEARLSRLSNRASVEQLAAIRETVRAHIPLPTDEEIARLAVIRQSNVEDGYRFLIKSSQTSIAVYEKYIKEARDDTGVLQPIVDMLDEGPASSEELGRFNTMLGQILFGRARSG
jgi:hypothetical protein